MGAWSFEEIREYYRVLAEASAVPLLIYYFPAFSPAIRTTEQMLELCALPNVAGLKFTDSDLFRMWALRRSGAAVFFGSDEMLAAGLLLGASGGIGSTYNLLARRFVELYRLACSARWEEARQAQGRINEVIAVILRYPVFPAVKALLRWAGIDCGRCIAPRRALTSSEESELRAQIARTAYGGELL